MKITKNILIILFSFTFSAQLSPSYATEKYNCESSTLRVYDEQFKCDNLNNYFKNQFYSNYLSRNLHDVQGKDESILIKPSSFALISDYLGIYTQKRNGKNIISFGFPDQKMSKDSQNLWNAFNQEFDKILKEPIKTNNLNNGFNSSIFEESI